MKTFKNHGDPLETTWETPLQKDCYSCGFCKAKKGYIYHKKGDYVAVFIEKIQGELLTENPRVNSSILFPATII
jgi:hypothetical protein